MALVVFGHGLIGVTTSLETSHTSRFCILLLYCLHMPTLFALAGFLSRGLITRLRAQFIKQVLHRIVWPYFLWSSLLLFLHFKMSAHTNVAVEVFRPWTILWNPPAVMWFLYVLFVAILARRLLLHASNGVVAGTGILIVLLAYSIDLPVMHVRFIGVFLVASAIAPSQLTVLRRPHVVAACLLIMGVLIWIAWQEAAGPLVGYPAARPPYLPALVAGPVLVFVLGAGLSKIGMQNPAKRLLQAIGRHSMAVFVLHIFFTAGARMVLLRLDFTDIWFITGVASLFGLAGPLALTLLINRFHVGAALGWQRA